MDQTVINHILYGDTNKVGLSTPELQLYPEHKGSSYWHTFIGRERVEVHATALTGKIHKIDLKESEFKGEKNYRLHIHVFAGRKYLISTGLKTVFAKGILLSMIQFYNKKQTVLPNQVTINVNGNEAEDGKGVVFGSISVNGYEFRHESNPSDIKDHQLEKLFHKVQSTCFAKKDSPKPQPQAQPEAKPDPTTLNPAEVNTFLGDMHKLGVSPRDVKGIALETCRKEIGMFTELTLEDTIRIRRYIEQGPVDPNHKTHSNMPNEAIQDGVSFDDLGA